MNRKLLILVGPVAGIVMFLAVVWIACIVVLGLITKFSA